MTRKNDWSLPKIIERMGSLTHFLRVMETPGIHVIGTPDWTDLGRAWSRGHVLVCVFKERGWSLPDLGIPDFQTSELLKQLGS